MKKIYQKLARPVIVVVLLVSFLISGPAGIFFEGRIFVLADEDLEKTCQALIEDTEATCKKISREECQMLLNKCLELYQEKSDYYEGKVTQTQQEKKTLQNQIYILKNKINRLNNEIYQSNLMITDLGLQIEDTQASIEVSTLNIEDSKERLAELLRLIYEQDQRSLVEIMLAEEELSDFFDELAALEALSLKNQELLEHIKALKEQLEGEKQALNEEKGELEQLVVVRTFQKGESQRLKGEQEWLLEKTKGQESLYQEYLKENQERAAEIRKRIFQLAQVTEEEAPSYEEAYKLAQYVETVTGVRAALLLGLLQVESAIGKNVGQCNCEGRAFCRHPEISWKEVMPKSNWESFQAIVKELGLEENTTPVSCSVDGGKVQWGGAMGPAQFMPNTWLSLGYKDRVGEITGQKPANPWRVKDAFLAAGLYLSDWGAASQTLKKEVGAVTAYLCGTSIMTARCKAAGGSSYRNLVLEKASQWEKWAEEGVF